ELFKKDCKMGFIAPSPTFSYIIISLLLTFITVNNTNRPEINTETMYLSTNGVHLNIILPVTQVEATVLKDIKYLDEDSYLSFGWVKKIFISTHLIGTI